LVHVDVSMFYVAAGYLDINIFLWDPFLSNKLKLRESFIVSSNEDLNRPQLHFLCSGTSSGPEPSVANI
jgi:hypothetical protein